jgi:hypothetical protein
MDALDPSTLYYFVGTTGLISFVRIPLADNFLKDLSEGFNRADPMNTADYYDTFTPTAKM